MNEPILNGEKTEKIDRDPLTGKFIKDNPGGPGRPKGRFSLTTQIIKRLEENPDQAKEIIDWLLANRKDMVWNKIDADPPKDLNLGGDVGIRHFIITEGDDQSLQSSSDPETSPAG